ncbi:hypothetical protein HID58_027186 [Brassica napus]|uniref:Uncharacterized protein n=3 Tax=Brassica TaxID=3705 RepID=A0ABQ8CR70_BRANA|nr:hypothetical protein HID58_027186 [Brassica napus]
MGKKEEERARPEKLSVYLYIPNIVGYMRVVLNCVAFAVCFSNKTLFSLLYFFSFCCDAVDGWCARRFNQVSTFGAVLDMVTDRVSTACLLVILSQVYRPSLVFLSLLALDIASHWLQMYSTFLAGKSSHKDVKDSTSWLFRLYYGNRIFMCYCCVSCEVLYIILLLIAKNQTENLLNVVVSTLTQISPLSFLLALTLFGWSMKQTINIIQMKTAADVCPGPLFPYSFAQKHFSLLLEAFTAMAKPMAIEVYNPNGKYRVVSTKPMPGTRWINLLVDQGCRVELTEDWGETLFSALSKAGGKAFSNMAVGYNNVDVEAANKYGIAVGNTPGVLTETTAELAASLSLAAARRIVEADGFMRAGLYEGWLPHLFVGNLLKGQTVGVIGAGRIGSAYARMMVEGFKMNLIYFDLYQSTRLEKFVTAYGQFLKANGEQPVTWKRASSMEEVLREADLISLHPVLDKTTYHLVNKERLAMMKKEAILVNCSRGPVIDEVALVDHLRENPMFRVGLDVFEEEPFMKPGLADMKNAIVVPHIASASKWTREGMATLAALNVLGRIKGYPIWSDPNRVDPFLNENASPPNASPSIVNSKALGLPVSKL